MRNSINLPLLVTIPQAFEIAVQHHQAGRLPEAEAIYRQILAVEPQNTDALHLLGVIAHQVGRQDLALQMILQAIHLNANRPEYYSNLGAAYAKLGRREEAIAAYSRALQLKPDYAEAHCNLGNAFTEQGQLDAAAAAFFKAVQFKPDYVQAHCNLGFTLSAAGRLDEAISACRRALQFKPDDASMLCNLGNTLRENGEVEEALKLQRRVIELKPDDASLHSYLILTSLYQPNCDEAARRKELELWEQMHGAPLKALALPHSNSPDSQRRIRIGYVSPDFYSHVVCHFLTPLLEAHDHAGFEIFCYASVKRPDALTERMKATADIWRDVQGMSDEALFQLIRDDAIDILVDLTMHASDNRLPVFARKPAPVQVAWLGHPGSTGLHAMDWRLTDHHLDPPGSPWSESAEKVMALPDSWFCYDPIHEFPTPGELPALRTGYVTFGSLNKFCKVNDAVLQRWAGVMHAVEGSRLLMRCMGREAGNRVRRYFESQGIAAERLELIGWLPGREAFLDLYRRIDIGLDPFPFNGGTTTCETLWMGIPVLTLPGSGAQSRIGLSILSSCGMPEFVAHSEADYLMLAKDIARDLQKLAHTRSTLRARMQSSPFMDAQRFARNVEHAFRQMWHTWCAKQSAPKTP